MKRPVLILLFGLVLAVGGFCALYLATTARHRAMLRSDTPELVWLKEEFKLNEADYKHVCDLHAAYMPRCEEMCRRIAAKNAELKELIAATNAVTPQIARTLEEANQLRAECHKGMLAHFFEVSKAMPPEQGRRYLAWVQEQTLLDHSGMMANHHQSHGHE